MMKFLVTAALTLYAFSTFAAPPADIKVKCTLTTEQGNSAEEYINFEYGSGQKNLTLKGAENIVVMVSDNNAAEAGLHDIKLFLKDSIVAAKSITLSDDQSHGIHVLQTSKKMTSSIFCGL